MEARQLPPSISQPLLGKVKDYKADLANLKDQMKKAAVASPVGEAARAELVCSLRLGDVWENEFSRS